MFGPGSCPAGVRRVRRSDGPLLHECSPERRADYQVFGLRDEVAQLEIGVHRYLADDLGLSSSLGCRPTGARRHQAGWLLTIVRRPGHRDYVLPGPRVGGDGCGRQAPGCDADGRRRMRPDISPERAAVRSDYCRRPGGRRGTGTESLARVSMMFRTSARCTSCSRRRSSWWPVSSWSGTPWRSGGRRGSCRRPAVVFVELSSRSPQVGHQAGGWTEPYGLVAAAAEARCRCWPEVAGPWQWWTRGLLLSSLLVFSMLVAGTPGCDDGHHVPRRRPGSPSSSRRCPRCRRRRASATGTRSLGSAASTPCKNPQLDDIADLVRRNYVPAGTRIDGWGSSRLRRQHVCRPRTVARRRLTSVSLPAPAPT